MPVINATNARKKLYKLIADVNESPETIYLNQVPGLAKSIIEGASEPLSDCSVYEEDEAW